MHPCHVDGGTAETRAMRRISLQIDGVWIAHREQRIHVQIQVALSSWQCYEIRGGRELGRRTSDVLVFCISYKVDQIVTPELDRGVVLLGSVPETRQLLTEEILEVRVTIAPARPTAHDRLVVVIIAALLALALWSFGFLALAAARPPLQE